MKDRIRDIERSALEETASAKDAKALEALRVKYLGRKGIVTELFKEMIALGPEEKKECGRLINALKDTITKAIDGNTAFAAAPAKEAGDRIDVTLPGISTKPGSLHPVTKTIQDICGLFISLGFRVVEGPEIEVERNNFEALNIPLEHPSRDAFDTFYLNSESGKYLLAIPRRSRSG